MALRFGKEENVLKPYPLKKVVILGMGLSIIDWMRGSYAVPPEHMEEGSEIWTVNRAGLVFRSHKTFTGHTPEVLPEESHEVYRKIGGMVVSLKAIPGVENNFEYPLAEVIEAFNENYIMNTVSYAIAFAMLCGVKRIELYGCDYNYRAEMMGNVKQTPYEHGRANVEYWIGLARAKGIFIGVGQSSMLLDIAERVRTGMYGFGEAQPTFEHGKDGKLILKDMPQPPSFAEVEGTIETGGKTLHNAKASPEAVSG